MALFTIINKSSCHNGGVQVGFVPTFAFLRLHSVQAVDAIFCRFAGGDADGGSCPGSFGARSIGGLFSRSSGTLFAESVLG